MVTREDVAKRAFVSTATVSNVINNKPGVSEELRNRVLRVIDELGYRPNMIARSLKTNETKQIALVSNGISNPYFAELTLGMEEEAFHKGYMISVLNAREHSHYIDEIINRHFDGIIMATDKIPIEEINRLSKHNIPTVYIGNEGYKGIDSNIILVNIDLYNGAIKLFEYLFSMGHKKIGFITARKLKDIHEPDYRLKAYCEVLERNNVDFDESIVYVENNTPEYAYVSTCKMLASKDKPSAIFAGNDYLAQGVYSGAAAFMLKIPWDISIVGFDNLNSSRYMVPTLTTVEVPHYELGVRVMDLLLRKMRGEIVDNIDMETSLVVRNSVRKITEE